MFDDKDVVIGEGFEGGVDGVGGGGAREVADVELAQAVGGNGGLWDVSGEHDLPCGFWAVGDALGLVLEAHGDHALVEWHGFEWSDDAEGFVAFQAGRGAEDMGEGLLSAGEHIADIDRDDGRLRVVHCDVHISTGGRELRLGIDCC